MKRIFLLLLISCAAAGLPAADVFTRVTRTEQLTEDGEYVIGAKGGPVYTSFYLLDVYNAKKKYFVATVFSNDIPEQITAPAVPAWHIVREGEHFALSLDGAYIALSKEETVLTSQDHISWQALPQPDGTFKFTDGQKYFRLNSLQKGSRFKCLADNDYEGTLVIYKRSIPLSSLTSYSRFWETAGWETVCLPFSCAVPQGFTAYAVSGNSSAESGNSSATLTYEETSQLQAGVSYVVRGEAGALFSVEKTSSYADAPRPGLLAGTYAPLSLASGYVLNGTDFVPAAPGCYLPPFCAYLQQK